MVALAYTLSLVCLILNASLFVRIKWPDGGQLMWMLHLLTGSISPFLVVAGTLGTGLGLLYHAPVAVAAGLLGAGISATYIVLVTASQPGFELAFGTDWETRIPAARETHMLKSRWSIWLPRTKEPRVERDLAFWTIPAEGSDHEGADRKLLCDVWQPAEGVARSGLAFIYIHGGCWYLLDKDFGTRPMFRHLAGQGHVIMDVAYRLCPEVDIHGMLGDVKRAVAWMKANAGRYQVNPDRIVLSGGSSGGHLALLAAYTPAHPGLTPPDLKGLDLSVQAVASYYGPADLRTCYSYLGQERSIGLPKVQTGQTDGKKNFADAGRLDILVGGHLHEVPEAYTLASPVAHVNPDCPPTLLIQGKPDVIASLASTEELHRRLIECEVPAVSILYPLTDHAFDLLFPQVSPPAQAALYYLDRFLALMT
jgi:acetyl esterase/lipase